MAGAIAANVTLIGTILQNRQKQLDDGTNLDIATFEATRLTEATLNPEAYLRQFLGCLRQINADGTPPPATTDWRGNLTVDGLIVRHGAAVGAGQPGPYTVWDLAGAFMQMSPMVVRTTPAAAGVQSGAIVWAAQPTEHSALPPMLIADFLTGIAKAMTATRNQALRYQFPGVDKRALPTEQPGVALEGQGDVVAKSFDDRLKRLRAAAEGN
jgi:hypothetical protein